MVFLGPRQRSFQYRAGQRSGGVLSALVESGAQKGLCDRVVAGNEYFVDKMATLVLRAVVQVKDETGEAEEKAQVPPAKRGRPKRKEDAKNLKKRDLPVYTPLPRIETLLYKHENSTLII